MQDRIDACQVGCRTGRMQAGGRQDRVKQDRIDAGIFNQFDFICLELCFYKRNVTYIFESLISLPIVNIGCLNILYPLPYCLGLYEACADGPDAGELCHGWGA